ncbi:hypothetical protein MN116_004614 [Schistosoma mekongi]|uniref:Kinase D-interacting substrate of 220 kDa-like SAM domain-containing protein n=1 Tax=Schistosoma mekongi TaxID=38744 RepID=A0AAE1ZDK0_SCHME|nr:hypothetical protein MN116_004614 [Schistosoma mekongi]
MIIRTSVIKTNMYHSHLHSTMTHASQRFPQQNTIHGQMKHSHQREQSSESITSTSRDFNTNRSIKHDSNYPQKQLTRKPRQINSQTREHSISRQYPYSYLHNMKDNHRKQLTNKEQMYYRKKASELQYTNESSGSTSNPNRNELNNHKHLLMTTNDSHLHECKQMSNMLHHINQKREIYDTKRMQSVGSIYCQPKKSNLDEIVGLAANDCHMFNYHSYDFNSSTQRSNVWNSTKPQMSTSYTTDSTVGNKVIGQQCQFGLNTLESFQQGCLTSLASMLLCPHTILPIMVGLFSNVGSSTDYVQKLGEELVYLKQSNPYYYDQTKIELGFWPGILPLIIVSILGYILGLSLGWQLGFAVTVTATLLYALFFGVIIFGVRIKHWSKTIELAVTISRYMRGCNLLFNILFYRSPQAPRIAQPVRLLPISINLSNFSTSTEAAVHLAEKIWISIEHKYGRLPVRLQWASKDVYGDSTKTYRKVCCLPSCIWVFVNVITLLTMATLIAIDNSFSLTENKDGTTTGTATSSSNPTPKIDGDVNTLTENFKVFIIICAGICGLSFLILIAAITPGIVKLIRGRPFQHPITKPFYPNLESYTDITLDSCYGNGIRKFYPISNCIESGQHDTSCFTHGAYYNHGSRQMLDNTNKLTSAVSMAAAAAAAAVTAADHHWRQNENSKYFNHHPQQMYERGQFKTKYECDLENGLNGINRKIDTNSNGHDYEDDDVDDDEDSSEESKQSDSNEHSTIEDEESSRTDGLLFNSGELLLNGQSIPNSNHRRFSKKHFLNTQDKEYSTSTHNRQRKTVNIERKKNEQLLRQYVLDACSVLSMLDRRAGGRQTRLIICINGINETIENSITNKKLLDFMHLLDHILMKPPTGGKSYDVPLILAPIGASEKVANNIPSTIWVPNAVIIIAANISGINQDNTKMQNSNLIGTNDYNQIHRISSTLRMSLTNSTIGSNPKIWYCIHQLCHLPIYIEDEPLGFKVFDQTNEHSFISPARSASNIHHSHEKTEVSKPKSLNDLYISKHELTHYNKKRFRHLLTLTAFMSRMIKLDRLYTQRIIYQTSQNNLSYLNALQYFANEPSLNTLMTWLCFITHWPFHAAWLGVFIENYHNSSIKERANYLLTNHTSRSQPEGLNLTLNDNKSLQFGMEQLGSNLTALYSRVIERLGPLLHRVRSKALSALFIATNGINSPEGTFHSNKESILTNKLLININETLNICEIAFSDKDPMKLGEFLRSIDTNQLDSMNSMTINQLLRIMKLTPFLNPQINKWITETLLPMINNLENNNGQKVLERKQVSSRNSRRSHTSDMKPDHDVILSRNQTETKKDSFTSFIIKLKETLPKKPLNQFTVNEVCKLIESIVTLTNQSYKSNQINQCQTINSHDNSINLQHNDDVTKRLSSEESETLINDPIPPSLVNNNTILSSTIKQYTDSIKQLNITGSVLDLCNLKDLQFKLNMSSFDWKLFCTLIQYLKQIEYNQMNISNRRQSINHHHHHHHQYTIPCKHSMDTTYSTMNNMNKLTEISKDHLLMNTISDTSLTVKSAPVIKHHDNEIDIVDHQHNIPLSNNRSLSMIGVNRLNCNVHVSQSKQIMNTSKQYLHSNITSEQVINNIAIPCDKHQSMLLHNKHNNQLYSHYKPKHYKSLEYDENICDCCMNQLALHDNVTVYRSNTLPHTSQIYPQKQNQQRKICDYPISSPISSNTTVCNHHHHHHKLTTDNGLIPEVIGVIEQEEKFTDDIDTSASRCSRCKLPINTDQHHHCMQQHIPEFYNSYKPVNSGSSHLNKPNELLHHSIELPIIRSHEIKRIIQPQSSTTHHINTTNDYIGITRKDSASTSLAGEIGDEVADMSQISNDDEENDNGSVLSDQKLERKQIKQSSSTIKHIDTVLYHHECDCKYWYTHEHQPKHHEHYHIEHIQHQSVKLPNHKIHSNIQNDQLNSSLDTLSTTTNSTCNDDSSNTSLTNDNASKHSHLDVMSINSCDQLTSEYSSDNTANSKVRNNFHSTNHGLPSKPKGWYWITHGSGERYVKQCAE